MSTSYKFFLLLHILAVVYGIGGVLLNGVYGAEAKKRPGPGGLAVSEANLAVTMIAEYVIYTIPVSGVILVLISPNDIWKFSQTWVWLSIVLYVVAVGIAHGVLMKNHKRMIGLQRELVAMSGAPAGGPPPQVAELEALGKQQAMGGMTNTVIAIVILYLMIWKPGL
jgi:uncharacterized membrane protein